MATTSASNFCCKQHQLQLTCNRSKATAIAITIQNPDLEKLVKVGKITVLTNMDSFQRYMFIRYHLPLKGLKLVNSALCQYFRETYLELNRKIQIVMRLVELYRPYLFFKGIFDDINTEKLGITARQSGTEINLFYFGPKEIDWEDYFINTYYHGLVKYISK
ncbi:fatty acyl-CoA reductase [Trifolium repens]|nr:fatty acyl-CoA reductase [Trifolium repens]